MDRLLAGKDNGDTFFTRAIPWGLGPWGFFYLCHKISPRIVIISGEGFNPGLKDTKSLSLQLSLKSWGESSMKSFGMPKVSKKDLPLDVTENSRDSIGLRMEGIESVRMASNYSSALGDCFGSRGMRMVLPRQGKDNLPGKLPMPVW